MEKNYTRFTKVLFLFVILLFSNIFSNNIFSMDNDHHVEDFTPPPKRLCTTSVWSFNNFVEEIRTAKTKYDFGVIARAYRGFKNADLAEITWEKNLETYHAIQWNSQSSKNAVGGQLFFDTALDKPHQNLLINALRPLLGITQDAQFLKECLMQTRRNVSRIISAHPYFRNRFTLYGLASAYHLGHPIAHLVLEEGLIYLYYSEEKKADEKDTEYRFFIQSHTLLELKLRNNLEKLNEFISLDGIEDFTDLDKASLSDVGRLQQKANLGLIHYDVLHEIRKNPKLTVDCYDENTLKKMINDFIGLGKKGDFEGYYNAAILIAEALGNHKIYKSEEDKKKVIPFIMFV